MLLFGFWEMKHELGFALSYDKKLNMTTKFVNLVWFLFVHFLKNQTEHMVIFEGS